MQVAALYDVHGNLPALEAVLAEIPDDATIVVGGDVAAGPFPAETRRAAARARRPRRLAPRQRRPGDSRRARTGFAPPELMEWIRERMTRGADRVPPRAAPDADARVDGLGRVLFCHAVPRNDMDVFTEATPEERVAPASTASTRISSSCGHTHMQFDRDDRRHARRQRRQRRHGRTRTSRAPTGAARTSSASRTHSSRCERLAGHEARRRPAPRLLARSTETLAVGS